MSLCLTNSFINQMDAYPITCITRMHLLRSWIVSIFNFLRLLSEDYFALLAKLLYYRPDLWVLMAAVLFFVRKQLDANFEWHVMGMHA